MNFGVSLRARLICVILVPLLIIAMLFGGWAYIDAQSRAAERFDRSLLSTALSISRDTAVSDGDALGEGTRDLLRDTSGGAVFYHVHAPDGVFVTGYATPPVPPSTALTEGSQTYYDAVYRGQPVRALRFTQTMSMDGLNGAFTFTVWQSTRLRDGFVRSRTWPTFLIISSMIAALAVIVWFGVRLGLSPLGDLEAAIARRSASDLSPIQRRIPEEVSGVVGKINTLFDELNRTLVAKEIFISDAAHQLRNPIAGVLSLAESVQGAKTPQDVQTRSSDLIDAARNTATLANNLLTLERARAAPRADTLVMFNPTTELLRIAHAFHDAAEVTGVHLAIEVDEQEHVLRGDPVLFEQAILNVLNNALNHGGRDLSEITLEASQIGQMLSVTISDNGAGIAQEDFEKALGRFSQVKPTAGSGLGLPIAQAIALAFGGHLALKKTPDKFSVLMYFQLIADA